VYQILYVKLQSASAQAQLFSGSDDRSGVGTATGAGDAAHLLQGQVVTVISQHHGQTSGPAVRGFELLDKWDSSPVRTFEPAQRSQNAILAAARRSLEFIALVLRVAIGCGRHYNLRNPGRIVNRMRSERTRTVTEPCMPS
jgi:hypothetical protein